jgi:hypothetical protein
MNRRRGRRRSTPAPEDEAAADGIDLTTAPCPRSTAPDGPPETPDAAPDTQTAETPRSRHCRPCPSMAVPSLEETEAVYAEYRIWQRPPDRPDLAPLDSLSDLSLSAVDPAVTALDAISLPVPRSIRPRPCAACRRRRPSAKRPKPRPQAALSRRRPKAWSRPTAFGSRQARRRFRPSPARVRRRCRTRTPVFSIEDAILGTFRPAPRPGDLGQVEPEDAAPERPVITRASLSPQPLPSGHPPATPGLPTGPPPPRSFPGRRARAPATNAVARSLVPAARPGNMETLVANAVRPAQDRQPAAVIEAAAMAPGPSIPSNADVARAATQSNELRLREVNLIGVTGTASDRRALVRLPSGRFVRVGVGDRLDGGRVAAIGASTLQYVRGGRTVTLDIPG